MTPDIVTKNWGMKLLAIVIAIALWVLVAGEEEAVKVYTVPLDFALSANRVLEGETPDTVQVRVRGSEPILRNLAQDDLSVPVDLTRAVPGKRLVRILVPANVQGVPSGVAVESVTPDHLTLSVERKISRQVRVSPRLEGGPAAGYRMVDFVTEPDNVTIEGPEGDVSRISLAYTDPIPLHGKEAGFTTAVNVILDSPRVRIVEAQPINVTVHIAKDETLK